MPIKRYLLKILIITFIAGACSKKTQQGPTPPPVVIPPIVDKNWQFETTPLWQDDFSTDGAPDPTKWSFETGGNGWGNHELEYYTNGANSTVTGGNLVIEARHENFSGMNYTSSRMVTKGKGDWLYGRFEIRAKLPKGKGTWPAIWMLSSEDAYGGWPSSGEMDIMEHVGFDPNPVYWTIHTNAYNHTLNTQKGSSTSVPDATDNFHIYRIDWTPYAIRFFLDGTQTFQFTNENSGYATWPFDKKFFLILNLAIGGDWGGAQGVDDTAFPTSLVVDYVKVFKMIE
jgi:beta-glucanase (GH16 family)